MHAERDIVIANHYIRLSVCHALVLYRNECTYRQTLSTVWQGHDSGFLEVYQSYKIPRGTPPAGALNTRGGKKLAIFDRNRRLSRKRHDIGHGYY